MMHYSSSKLRLMKFIESAQGKCLILTGAGISTDSGIPDYRGIQGIYVRNPTFKPIQYHQFIIQHEYRQRYWARSFLGWPKIRSSRSNSNHHAIFKLKELGLSHGLITQNVDGLHYLSDPLELHGSLYRVECQGCFTQTTRDEMQDKLIKMNPELANYLKYNPTQNLDVASSNPDGDVEIRFDFNQFRYPVCSKCQETLKPSVVFFGENICLADRNRSFSLVEESRALMVVASSLQVYSAFRLVKRAKELKIPVAILNLGETRADQLADLKIDLACNPLLSEVVNEMNRM